MKKFFTSPFGLLLAISIAGATGFIGQRSLDKINAKKEFESTLEMKTLEYFSNKGDKTEITEKDKDHFLSMFLRENYLIKGTDGRIYHKIGLEMGSMKDPYNFRTLSKDLESYSPGND